MTVQRRDRAGVIISQRAPNLPLYPPESVIILRFSPIYSTDQPYRSNCHARHWAAPVHISHVSLSLHRQVHVQGRQASGFAHTCGLLLLESSVQDAVVSLPVSPPPPTRSRRSPSSPLLVASTPGCVTQLGARRTPMTSRACRALRPGPAAQPRLVV